FSHRLREIPERLDEHWRQHEFRNAAKISRRMLVEKHCRVRRQAIVVSVFAEKTDDAKEVAEDAHAALGCSAALSDLGRGFVALTDRSKGLQLDCRFQCFYALVGIDG